MVSPVASDGGVTEKIASVIPSSLTGIANWELWSGSAAALPGDETKTIVVCGEHAMPLEAPVQVARTYPRSVELALDDAPSSAMKVTKLPSALIAGEWMSPETPVEMIELDGLQSFGAESPRHVSRSAIC